VSDLRAAINAYREASTKLQDAYIELGETRAAEISARRDAFVQLSSEGRSITECREHASAAGAYFSADAVKQQADIDALLAELRWLDVWITHLRGLPLA
jgi:ClpP class serine protease